MDRKRNLEAQRRFVAEKQGQGLKRVVLWARPEDVETLKALAGQPHAAAQHLAEMRARIERDLEPKIRAEVAAMSVLDVFSPKVLSEFSPVWRWF